MARDPKPAGLMAPPNDLRPSGEPLKLDKPLNHVRPQQQVHSYGEGEKSPARASFTSKA